MALSLLTDWLGSITPASTNEVDLRCFLPNGAGDETRRGVSKRTYGQWGRTNSRNVSVMAPFVAYLLSG